MEMKQAIQCLSALAQETRLSAFRLLVERGPEGLTPGELSAELDIPGPTLSFHLKELAHAGLVSTERRGRSLAYRARVSRVDRLLDYLTANCCGGDADLCRDAEAADGRRRA